MVWRTPGDEFDPKCTVPTVKHDGGSVMVWGCFTRRGVGKLCVLHRIIDRFYYRNVLEQNLLPSIDHFKFWQQSHFMHENDPKHTSGLVKDWLKQKAIQTLKAETNSIYTRHNMLQYVTNRSSEVGFHKAKKERKKRAVEDGWILFRPTVTMKRTFDSSKQLA